MFTLLIIIMLILSILLILVVLVQPGKGDMLTGMGSLGGSFSSVLGSRRAMDMLTKMTIGFASAILVLSLVTNMFFVRSEESIPRPVTEGVQMPATAMPQPVPLQQPTETPIQPVEPPQE